MPITIEHILSLDEWTEADRQAVREAVAADPQLGVALVRWFAMAEQSSRQWDATVPSRMALVLLACRDRLHTDDLSSEERVLLEAATVDLDAALAAHPAVEDVLARIRSEADAFDQAWNQSFSEAKSRVDRGPLSRDRASRTGPLRLVRLAVAAAAVIAVFFVGRGFLSSTTDAPFATFATGPAAQVVELTDGTVARLAPETSLDVLFDAETEQRLVRIDGEAFFDVTPGPRPFKVESGNALTTVLGTAFGLRATDGTDVQLVSGRVSLAAIGHPDEAVILTPGDRGFVPEGSTEPVVRSFDSLEGFDWTGLLVFRNTPMAEVAERLSKEFEVVISVSEELKEAPLTGTFESDRGSEIILDIIAAALGATVTKNEDGSFHLSV